MEFRTARPTLRVLTEDLAGEGTLKNVLRSLGRADTDDLGSLCDLPHPIIAKAATDIGEDPTQDSHEGLIRGSTTYRLFEVKSGQWRGGVWPDDEGSAHWLVVAGLAKGDHKDHDDFYARVERAQGSEGACQTWLPTAEDRRLLRREILASTRIALMLDIQRLVLDALSTALASGSAAFDILLPAEGKLRDARVEQRLLTSVEMTMTPERSSQIDTDDLVVSFNTPPARRASELEWDVRMRVLISLMPPEQGWDGDDFAYWNMAEPGAWQARVQRLQELVTQGFLEESVPGRAAHRAHRRGLTHRSIEGKAVRGLCGVPFVPRQDHESLPACEACEAEWQALPQPRQS